jgi:glycerol-3-phosphate cytidylyltransferase
MNSFKIKKFMEEKKFKVGYTTGVFDLFHIGHLNILKRAKEMCDFLIVGVTTDELTLEMKNKASIIPFIERVEIVKGIRYVDKVVPKINTSTIDAWQTLQFDVIFKGDDWKNTEKGNKLEMELKEVGAEIWYFPYTDSTSSTVIRKALDEIVLNQEANKVQ